MASRPLRPEDPRWLGAYQLVGRLGEGGMGTVFLGRDQAGNPVAVKAIRSEYADQEEFRARFRSEVNRVRQVPSFCTAAVLDADPDHHTPYLVVEYVDGPSLRDVITERGPMSVGDLHSVAVGVAAALTAIHGAGVIHRDLKPTNVLLSLGLPKVIDFGIARAMEATSRHTRTDQVFGTVSYLAPERLDSALGPTSQAADIFAWGAVVTYAGTGRTPFGGDTPTATVARILTMQPDLAGLPESLAGLVRRALAKDPQARPTANELVQELLATSDPRATGPGPASPSGPSYPGLGPLASRIGSDLGPSHSSLDAARGPYPSPPPDFPRSHPAFAPLDPLRSPSPSPSLDSHSGAWPSLSSPPGAYGDARLGSHGDARLGSHGDARLGSHGDARLGSHTGAWPSLSPPPGAQGDPRLGSPGDPRLDPGSSRHDPRLDAGGSRHDPRLNPGGSHLDPSHTSQFNSRELLRQLIDDPAEPTPPSRGRSLIGRRSAGTRRLLYATIAILLVTVSGATIAYSWAGDRSASSLSVPTASHTPDPAPTLRGPSFFDPLSAPGRVRKGVGDDGSCTFDGGHLIARTKGATTYQCPGSGDTFSGDQAITVDVPLAAAGSCAMIWFRYRDGHGYQVTACPDQVELEQAGGAVLFPIGRVPTTTLSPGTRHQMSITVVDNHAAVAIDGALTMQAALSDQEVTSGQIVLGVTNSATTGSAEASFADLDVRTG